MKRYSILLSAFLFLMYSQSAFAQSAKDALMALKKIQMKCETGILYNEYIPALSEAKTPVMEYLQSPASRNEPEFSDALGSALGHYECAGRIFDYMFNAGAGQHFVSDQDPALFAKIKQRYPEVHLYVKKDISGFSYSEAIHVMWTRGASEVERAFDNFPSKAVKNRAKGAEKKADEAPVPDQTNIADSRLKRQINSQKHEIQRLRKENKDLRRELDKLKGRQ